MTKATLTLPNGAIVQIEGSPEEVKALLGLYTGSDVSSRGSRKHSPRRKRTNGSGIKKVKKAGPVDLIRELISKDYFKGQKRSLSDIQQKLEEEGHLYAQTSLSTPMTRLTRSRALRRIKEEKGWMYVI